MKYEKGGEIITFGLGTKVDNRLLHDLSSFFFPVYDYALFTKIMARDIVNITICNVYEPPNTALTNEIKKAFQTAGLLANSDDLANDVRIKEASLYATAQLPERTRRSMGYQKNKTILQCSYDQQECDLKNEESLKSWIDPSYGNCFTFNYDGRYKVTKSGKSGGLFMLLFANTAEYMCTSETTGFRVNIHPQGEHPFPDENGHYTKSSHHLEFALLYNNYNMLGAPYRICASDDIDYQLRYEGNYTVEACQRTCLQSHIIKKCNCASPKFGAFKNESYCTLTSKACVDDVLLCSNSIIELCDCPTPCDSSNFPATATSSIFELSYLYNYYCKPYKITWNECAVLGRQEIAGVTIYVKSLNYYSFTERPEYSLGQLMSEVGGTMGLLTGMSVMMLIELGLIIGDCCCCSANRCAIHSDYYYY